MKIRSLVSFIAYALGTCFGLGFVPLMPGTVCSLATIVLFFFLPELSLTAWTLFFIVTMVLGVWSSSAIEQLEKKKDPSRAVIDELVGQAIPLCFIPKSVVGYALAFVLFRIFDISKAWPACWVERRVPGGWGIMLDDVVAGLWACAIWFAIAWCWVVLLG